MLLIARILAGFDMADPALSEADRIHLLAEATKVAYRQRDALVADPAFHALDVEALLSDTSITALRSTISTKRASAPVDFEMPVHRDTAYVAVADRDGNMVSFINSLFFAFGSGIYAPVRACCCRIAARVSASSRAIPTPSHRESVPFTPSFRACWQRTASPSWHLA